MEKEVVRIITGFIGNGTSVTLFDINTTNYHIQGKAGSWFVIDSIIIDDKKNLLMEHDKYGSNAVYVVLDECGVVVIDNNCNGFDNYTKRHIREYIRTNFDYPTCQW